MASLKSQQSVQRIALLALLLLATLWFLLSTSGDLTVDEVLHAYAGYKLVRGEDLLYGIIHSHLGRYFIGLGEVLTSLITSVRYSPFGFRLFSIITGVASLYIVYKLGESLHSATAGLFSTVLLLGTLLFSRYTPRALLDVPLTFLIVLLFYLLIGIPEEAPSARRLSLATGVVAALGLLMKLTGFLFVAPIFCAYLILDRTRGLKRKQSMRWRLALLAFFLTLLLVNIPYILTPTKDFGNDLHARELMKQHTARAQSSNVLTRSRLYKAYVTHADNLPSLFYMIDYAAIYHIKKLKDGGKYYVGGQIYDVPPLHAYLLWFPVDSSPLLLVGFMLFSIMHFLNSHKSRAEQMLFWTTTVTFMVLSLFPFKNFFYILPLIPLLALSTVLGLMRLLSLLSLKNRFLRSSAIQALAVLVIIGPFLRFPLLHLGADSGYGGAAEYLLHQYAIRLGSNQDTSVHVWAFRPESILYYLYRASESQPGLNVTEEQIIPSYDLAADLGQERPGIIVHMGGMHFDPEAIQCEMIRNGSFTYILDERVSLRFGNTPLFNCIRDYSEKNASFGDNLALYEFVT